MVLSLFRVTGRTLAAALLLAGAAQAQHAQPASYGHGERYCPPSPNCQQCQPVDPRYMPPAPEGVDGSGLDGMGDLDPNAEPSVEDLMNQPTQQPAAPQFGTVASSFGSASSDAVNAPNMLGDNTINPTVSFLSYDYTLPIAGGAGGFKIAENGSILPRDRVLFTFNNYWDALDAGDAGFRNAQAYSFGFEKTALDGLVSLEVRLPFAQGFDSTQSTYLTGPTGGTEFGNIPIVLKGLLYRSCTCVMGGGMSIVTPTADDAELINGGNVDFLVENDVVFLQPYWGIALFPNDRLFAQFYVQTQFAANGYDIYESGTYTGTLNPQSLLFLDWQLGYWLHKNPCSVINGLAAVCELHYTTTLNDADEFGDVADVYNRRDIVNLTLGSIIAVGNSTINAAGVIPLQDDEDLGNRAFDAEFQLQFNRYF